MATFKIKFRTSTVTNTPGTIYYQICHRGSHRQITTKIHVYPYEWNTETDSITQQNSSRPILKTYIHKIDNDIRLLQNIIQELDEALTPYTIDDIIRQYQSRFTHTTILAYMHMQIEILEKKGRYGTAENYRCAMNSFARFLDNHDQSICILNEGAVTRYNDYLEEQGVTRNTISFYMRIWRAVYNRAVSDRIIGQTHPFQNVYTGVDKTRKRAVDEATIMKLLKADLKGNRPLTLARDIFIFSYCTRGMAFVDIAYLRTSNIENGILTYYRQKTHQMMSIYIEPCIKYIIDKYQQRSDGTDYLFPILTTTDSREAFVQYHTALGYYNRKLKQLARIVGIKATLTSYTPRHSWATTARNHNIPISVISAGMGHTSERTTEIYLASLQNSEVDTANKNVLKDINRYISF